MAENVTYSLQNLRYLSQGDEHFIKEMVQSFIENSIINMKGIENALAANDLLQIIEHSHKMKPAVTLLKTGIVQQLTLDVLQMARDNKPMGEVAKKVRSLRVHLDQLHAIMQKQELGG
jgi:hypothetical protein